MSGGVAFGNIAKNFLGTGMIGGKGAGGKGSGGGNIDINELLTPEMIQNIGTLYEGVGKQAGKGLKYVLDRFLPASKQDKLMNELELQKLRNDFELKKFALQQGVKEESLNENESEKRNRKLCKCKSIKDKKNKGDKLTEEEREIDDEICSFLSDFEKLDKKYCK